MLQCDAESLGATHAFMLGAQALFQHLHPQSAGAHVRVRMGGGLRRPPPRGTGGAHEAAREAACRLAGPGPGRGRVH